MRFATGDWVTWEPGQYLGAAVFGATLGIIGFGRIGRAVARRASGFDMTVLHTGSGVRAAPGATRSRRCSSARTSSRSTARSRRRRTT